MEHEVLNLKYNNDIEEGEISDSDGDYTPLQRPGVILQHLSEQPNNNQQQGQTEQQKQLLKETKMDDVDDVEDSTSDFGVSSDTSSDPDDVIYAVKSGSSVGQSKRKQKKKRTMLLRVKPKQDNGDDDDKDDESKQKHKNKFKKYNVWTDSLQEESLTENMRGIDVSKYPKNDRNVESYDFQWKYKLERKNGSGGFKRRMSSNHSGDDFSDTTYSHQNKRSKQNFDNREQKSTIKNRLGRRKSATSSFDSQNSPRFILDLNVSVENNNMEIARDIANKLCEEKDKLMIRVVETLGKEIPIEIFKETQRIERDGGMMIMNGNRRRTPGGVFLFLIKHHDNISAKDKELIFHDEANKTNKQRKKMKSTKRDKKVEELKKQLSLKEKELPALSKRTDIPIAATVCHLKPDAHTNNLSNPPPSPVTNGGLENSPDYSSHAINHVNDACPGKSTVRTISDENLVAYDDHIDMNYNDMDLF